jgi:hypothetical protein
MRMADRVIDRDMRHMATHTQVRVPALPMPDHALAVDDPVVDIPVVITAADITVTENTAIKKTV